MAAHPLDKSLPKVVTFDVGNVIVKWDPRNAYAPLFQNRVDELDYFLSDVCSMEWHIKHDRGMAFAENIKDRQKEFPEYHDMIGRFEDEWPNMFGDLIEGTIALIHKLHQQKVPLYALTNYHDGKFAEFHQQHAFMNLFEDAIVSGEEKVTKPAPEIYEILLHRTRSVPEEILFIDDRLENLVAAEKFGIQTHLFIDPETLEKDLISRGILPG